jgi:hypothetical protein
MDRGVVGNDGIDPSALGSITLVSWNIDLGASAVPHVQAQMLVSCFLPGSGLEGGLDKAASRCT